MTEFDASLLGGALADVDFLAVAVLRDRHFLWVNRGMETLMGYPAEELIGQSTRLVFPDEASYLAFGETVYDALAESPTYRIEAAQRCRSGRIGWFEFKISRLAGQPDTFLALVVDRSAQQKLRIDAQILANISDCVVVTSRQGHILYVNEAFSRLFGYAPDEVLGQYVSLLNAGRGSASNEQVTRAIIDALASRGRWDGTLNNRRKDGSTFSTEASMTTHDSAEYGQLLISVQRDITERQRAEEALRQSREQFRRIFEHAPVGIAITDLQGRFLMCNPAYEKLLDCREAELQLTEFASWIQPEDLESNLRQVRRLLAGECDFFQIENRYRRKDGSTVWVSKVASCLDGEGGRPTQFFVIASDISDRKRAELAVQENQAILDLALAGTGLGVWDADLPSEDASYDERFCGMLGRRPGEIEPTLAAWQRLMHPDDAPQFNAALQAHYAGETPRLSVEHRLRHKEGHWVWTVAQGRLSHDAGGRPARLTGTLQDISDRKRIATEGADLLAKIGRMIADISRQPTGIELSAADAPEDIAAARLSRRHREVLALIAEGLTTAEIAESLGIARETVSTHRRLLMQKLGLKNKAAMIRYALKHNLTVSS